MSGRGQVDRHIVGLNRNAVGDQEPFTGSCHNAGPHALLAGRALRDRGENPARVREQIKLAKKRRGGNLGYHKNRHAYGAVSLRHGGNDHFLTFSTLVLATLLSCSLSPTSRQFPWSSPAPILPTKTGETFRAQLRGEVLDFTSPSYDSTCVVWNGTIARRPLLIARCRNAADIAASVCFARGHFLPLAVRCGDHNVVGCAVCENGLMIDLSLMNGVQTTASLDPRHPPGQGHLGGCECGHHPL